ncbi:hypothetical protein P9112_002893 [Eukaryota sp. TZLM1-RC]
MSSKLTSTIAEKAQEYLPLAVEMLKEVIRIPADYVDKPTSEGGDPQCGLSNHEGPRVEYLKSKIIEIGAVAKPEDVYFDRYGNLIWDVENPDDGIPREQKKVIWYDGHTDTVQALREQWHSKIGGGIDVYDGLTDISRADEEFLKSQLGHVPPKSEWEHLIFGRGGADQLGGVISQVIATKIMLETKELGSLDGLILKSIGTITEEDNDGGGPMFILREYLANAPSHMAPDCVMFTEPTGSSERGALGIYRGQRGRMIIEVEVIGQSCHGSMPWMGKNPFEWGSKIIAEAADAYDKMEGMMDDPFLGHGTRTASWCTIDTPSDCAVPDRFVFRFDRRLTAGETAEFAVKTIEDLKAVSNARDAGLTVSVRVPRYTEKSWRGTPADNDMIYPGWKTPEDHECLKAACKTYEEVVTPYVTKEDMGNGESWRIKKEVRLERFVFSTDGVGFVKTKEQYQKIVPKEVTDAKKWCQVGDLLWPPMLAFSAGHEQNTHKIGEFTDARELKHGIAFLSKFPSMFAAKN